MIKTHEIEEEIQRISAFPDEKFTAIIREVGFECDCCGKCCTNAFNDHVFLLDDDAARIINALGLDFLRPAPYFDFCDNLGRFYVLGYALKSKPNGDCIFYNGRCEHYEIRPDICRIFPYMLHLEPDEDGNIEFRQIGGLNEHGLYHSDIDRETCKEIVRQVKTYESGFLRQKLRFMNAIEEHFKVHALKHTRQIYDRMMRKYENGREIDVYVFFHGGFEKKTISKQLLSRRTKRFKG